MQFAAVSERPMIQIDPRTKFVLLFFTGFYMFAVHAPAVELGIYVSLSLLLLLYRQMRTIAKLSGLFFAMLLLDLYLSPLITGPLSALFYTCVRLFRMFFPIYLAALLLIRTTTVSEFIAAFRKLHLPDAFIIPVSVMFRFIPTVTEEWHSIRNAMRFRGIGVSAKTIVTKPMLTLEYMMIPILMSTATISGELAAASLSRGLDSGTRRTCVAKVGMGIMDYILLLCCAALLAWMGVIAFD